MYEDYSSSLEMTGLETLRSRRLKRFLYFSKKRVQHPWNMRLYPIHENNPIYKRRCSKLNSPELPCIKTAQYHFASVFSTNISINSDKKKLSLLKMIVVKTPTQPQLNLT